MPLTRTQGSGLRHSADGCPICLENGQRPLVRQSERAHLELLIARLQTTALGDDRLQISAALVDMETETKNFAAQRMDKSIRKAFAGKKIESLENEAVVSESTGESA